MKKLELPLKLFSQASKTPLCKNLQVGSIPQTNPKHLLSYSFTQSHLGLGLFKCHSHSYHWVCGKFCWFLQNPVFKQVSRHGRRGLGSVVAFTSKVPRSHFRVHPYNTSRNWRSWIPTSDNVVLGLVVANSAVFLFWRVVDPAFMKKNFMISVENFTSGRLHTLITSAFSHVEVGHLLFNMLGLYLFGTPIGRYFGGEFLLKLYLAGALGGSIFYMVHHNFMSSTSKGSGIVNTNPKKIQALGANGAVNAIMLLYIFLFPRATLYFCFVIPVPASFVGAYLIGNDLWALNETNSHVFGSAHLGGALVAALAWARIRKRWI